MPLPLGRATGLTIEANVSPCAHICRYCSIGDRDGKFPLNRYLSLLERFKEWGKATDHYVGMGFMPAYNFSVPDLLTLWDWEQRVWNYRPSWIPLGGVQMRDESRMHDWLAERQAVGLKGIAASFAGIGVTHDRMQGRNGDFDFLMRTLRTASEMGLSHGTTLFLTKSSLPQLEELAARLDELPTPHEGRHVRPFYYIGHGGHREDERITEEDRAAVPPLAQEALERFKLHTERHWINVHKQTPYSGPSEFGVRLELSSSTIDQLEAQSCDTIFSDLETRARETLSQLPSDVELSREFSDLSNTRLYSPVDVVRLWRTRFIATNGIAYDRKLLHHEIGGPSVKPPRLAPAA